MKKEVKKAKKALKKKMEKMADESDKEETKMMKKLKTDNDYDPPDGSLVVRKSDGPEKTKMRIAKLESELKDLDEQIKHHRKTMLKHLKHSEKKGSYKNRFKDENDKLRRERKRIMKRMKKKYKKLREKSSKHKIWRQSYERRIRDLEGAFRAFKTDMMNKMREKQSSDIAKSLDKIQQKFAEKREKKKAMRFVDKMAKKVGKKVESKKKLAKKVEDSKFAKEAAKDQKLLDNVASLAASVSKKGVSEGWAWENERTDKADDVFNYFKAVPDSAKDFGFHYPPKAKGTANKQPAASKGKTQAKSKAPATISATLKKKAEKFAKKTATLLKGEYVQHRCRKKLRKCKARLQKHLKILRECEKDKEGDDAPCWEEVKRTNELVMNEYHQCNQLKKKCKASGKRGKKGEKFKDRVAKEVDEMDKQFTDEVDALKGDDDEADERPPQQIHESHESRQDNGYKPPKIPAAKAKESNSTSGDPNVVSNGKQIIIRGGVQHFYLKPASAPPADKNDKKGQSKEDLEFDGPQIDIDDSSDSDKTDLNDPYLTHTDKLMKDKNLVKNYTGEDLSDNELQSLYDFFKADANSAREPVKGYNKPFGHNIDTSKRASNNGWTGWAGKKYRQFSQFFGRRLLTAEPSEPLSIAEDTVSV